MPTMLGVRTLASAVAGGTRSIALDAKHSPMLHAAGAAARHLVRPALSSSSSIVLLGHNPVRCCYSVSPFVGGGDAIVGDDGKSSAQIAAPSAGSRTHTFFVQFKGDPGFSPIVAQGNMLVGFLLKEVANELRLTQRISSLTFQLASEDGTFFTTKGANGKEQPATLNSMDTVDEALEKAMGRPATPKDKLRIIVDVAAAPAPPPLAASAAELRAQAQVLSELRTSLAQSSPILKNLATLTLSSPDLTALSGCSTTAVPPSLVQFEVPGVLTTVVQGPKGLAQLMSSGGSILLEEGRLSLSQEFVKAMTAQDVSKFGVLLSGPNGVGKSAIGMLSYLACVAQRLPVVYIPSAGAWVTAAKHGQGDAFFLRMLLQQNADIIQSDAELMDVFTPLMRHADETHQSLSLSANPAFCEMAAATMKHLVNLLPRRRFGVIVDEVQKITEAAEHDKLPYFKEGWYGWQDPPGSAFVRMGIASSHGLREFTLASGEEPRLRFVRPWPRKVVMDFLGHNKSPGYLEDVSARERLHWICGGVVRSLFDAKRLVGVYGSTQEGLDDVEEEMREAMLRSCEKWMKEASPDVLARCASTITKLFKGSARWEDLKPAYDQGLVALALARRHAVPVSEVAASVLHQALARHLRKNLVPLDAVREGSQRGHALEEQLHAVLDPCGEQVSTFSLDGRSRSKALTFKVDYTLPFLTVATTKSAATTSRLYLPKSDTYPCDAIIVPAANRPDDPVLLLEASVTHPRYTKRASKVHNWFSLLPGSKALTNPQATGQEGAKEPKRAPEEFGGFIHAVKAAHPGRSIAIALCWLGRYNDDLSSRTEEDDDGSSDTPSATRDTSTTAPTGDGVSVTKPVWQQLIDAANNAEVDLCVLDESRLEKLGIRTRG